MPGIFRDWSILSGMVLHSTSDIQTIGESISQTSGKGSDRSFCCVHFLGNFWFVSLPPCWYLCLKCVTAMVLFARLVMTWLITSTTAVYLDVSFFQLLQLNVNLVKERSRWGREITLRGMEEARRNDATHGFCGNHPPMVVNLPKRYKKDSDVVCIGEETVFSSNSFNLFLFSLYTNDITPWSCFSSF